MIDKNKELNHCCISMDFQIKDINGIMMYRSYRRQYAVTVGISILQDISHCPWCGVKLPIDLSDIFFEEIDKLGIEIEVFDIKAVPDEFQSEEWWRKRGL